MNFDDIVEEHIENAVWVLRAKDKAYDPTVVIVYEEGDGMLLTLRDGVPVAVWLRDCTVTTRPGKESQ
jgi:hypothetical protein